MLRNLFLLLLVLACTNAAVQTPAPLRTLQCNVAHRVKLVFTQQAGGLRIAFSEQLETNAQSLQTDSFYRQVVLSSKPPDRSIFSGEKGMANLLKLDSVTYAHSKLFRDELFLTNDAAAPLLALLDTVQPSRNPAPATKICIDGFGVQMVETPPGAAPLIHFYRCLQTSDPVYQLIDRSFRLYREEKGRYFVTKNTWLPFGKAR